MFDFSLIKIKFVSATIYYDLRKQQWLWVEYWVLIRILKVYWQEFALGEDLKTQIVDSSWGVNVKIVQWGSGSSWLPLCCARIFNISGYELLEILFLKLLKVSYILEKVIMPCPCSLKCIIVQTISNHLSWAGEVCCAVLCEYFQILQRILSLW